MNKLAFLWITSIITFGIFMGLTTPVFGAAAILNPITRITAPAPEIESPGVLPTNPFYFVKKFTWSFRRLFTFDPVKKADLELKAVDLAAAEMRKVSELTEKKESLGKAVKNYSENLTRLKTIIESLKESGTDSDFAKILAKAFEQRVRHEAIFETLKEKSEALRESLENAEATFDGVLPGAPKEKTDISETGAEEIPPIQAERIRKTAPVKPLLE